MVLLGSLSCVAWNTEPLSSAAFGGEAGGVEDLHEGAGPEPQRAHDGQAFPVHPLDDARHRGREGLSIEQHLSAVLLDPAGIPHHPGGVHDGIDVGQARLQHVLRGHDVGEYGGDLGQDIRSRLRRECRAPEVGGAPVDLNPRRPGHAADGGEGHGLAAPDGDTAARPPQLVDEMQAAPGLAGVQVHDLVLGKQRRQGTGHEPVGHGRHGDGDQVRAGHGFVQRRRDEVGPPEGLPPLLYQFDAATPPERPQGFRRTGIEPGFEPADCEIRRGGAPAVAGAENRYRPNAHRRPGSPIVSPRARPPSLGLVLSEGLAPFDFASLRSGRTVCAHHSPFVLSVAKRQRSEVEGCQS